MKEAKENSVKSSQNAITAIIAMFNYHELFDF
jgi:hypothetical protein